jgi:levanase/fructan beta-fructosidase
MVLAAGQKIMFYSSSNLKDWKLESDFGDGIGAHGGVWECPDFFPMVVQGTDEIKWVLLVSINPGGPNGGSATQYFVGDFDGKQFKVDPSFENDLNDSETRSIWIDYGRDNYAGVTWANIPDTDGRKLFVGWMSNWDYANVVPTEKWRSAMTIPREITLVKYGNQYRLKSLPIKELQNYVSKVISEDVISITDETVIAKSPLVDFTKLDIQFSLSELKNDIYTFILNNSKGESIEFGLNNKEGFFFIDRSKSGNISFSEKFSNSISKAFLKKDLKNLDVRIILDKTSIELFINDGETVITEIFFNTQPFDSFSLKSVEHGVEIKNINIKQLKFN